LGDALGDAAGDALRMKKGGECEVRGYQDMGVYHNFGRVFHLRVHG
jgi:hypothetical protein